MMASKNYQEVEYSSLYSLYLYLNYHNAADGSSIKQILETMEATGQIHDGNREVFEILWDAAVSNPDFGNSCIGGQSWNMDGYNAGTAACVFRNPDGSYYVAYQGTGDGEWLDNGYGMVQTSTIQQQQGCDYFDYVAEMYGWDYEDNIVITGHSKGGNKAQYTTINANHKDLIDTCYSLDGQGFSPEAIDQFKEIYGEEYWEAVEKMYGINGSNDFVNGLGTPVIMEDRTYYIDNSDIRLSDFAGLHELQNYFKKWEDGHWDGTLKEFSEQGEFGAFIGMLSDRLMELSKKDRENVSIAIMQLMELGGNQKIGINGEYLTLKQAEGLGWSLGSWLRQVMVDEIGQNVVDFLEDAGRGIKEIGEKIAGSIYGKDSKASYENFEVNTTVLAESAERLRQQAEKFRVCEDTIREIKRNMDFGFLVKNFYGIKLAARARDASRSAGKLEKMAAALEKSIVFYEQNENILEERIYQLT